MWLNQTAAPSGAPITLDEAKAHCRVDHNDDDALISSLITAAAQHLDGRRGYLGRCLLTQSWEYRVHCFPKCGVIELPLPPLQSVESVKYIDDAGVEQTLVANADYVVDTATYHGQVRRAYDVVWPVARLEDYVVRIVFTAGFGTAEAVPQPIKTAMLMMIGHLYEHRETVADSSLVEVPLAARWLLGPYRLEPM
jgi:uncharacterized phiE125 gp8 family phage protein